MPYQKSKLTSTINETGLMFATPEGKFTLERDGTFKTEGTIYTQMIADVFQLLEPPTGGRSWWKVFAVNAVFQSCDLESTRVGKESGMNANYIAIARNNELVKWIKESEIYKKISVDAFSSVRGYLWNKDVDWPRTDSIAEAILDYIDAHPNTGRGPLIAIATRHEG